MKRIVCAVMILLITINVSAMETMEYDKGFGETEGKLQADTVKKLSKAELLKRVVVLESRVDEAFKTTKKCTKQCAEALAKLREELAGMTNQIQNDSSQSDDQEADIMDLLAGGAVLLSFASYFFLR